MKKRFIDGLVAAAHPDSHFYNCNGCCWSGDELAYADGDGRGCPLAGGRNNRPYKPWQGHCPRCGRAFVGTRAEV